MSALAAGAPASRWLSQTIVQPSSALRMAVQELGAGPLMKRRRCLISIGGAGGHFRRSCRRLATAATFA